MQSDSLSANGAYQRAMAAERAGKIVEALEHAILACSSLTVPSVVLTDAARIATKAGDHGIAADWYERALTIQPSKVLKFSLSVALMESGNLVRAENELRNAILRSPKEFDLLNLLGVVIKRAGRLEEALDWFNKAVRLSPKTPSLWVNMGNCHMALGAFEKAVECFECAKKQEPRNSENYRLLGSALRAARQEDKALATLKTALLLSPMDYRIYMDITSVHYAQQNSESALRVIDEAVSRFPGNIKLLRTRASILRSLGRIDEALVLFEDILRQSPDDVDSLIMLGNLYLKGLGKRKEANKIYERALAIDPNHIETLRNYCESLTNSRYGDEMAHFQKAYELACSLLEKLRNPIQAAGTLMEVFLRAADYERVGRLGKSAKLIQHWVNAMEAGYFHIGLGRVQTMEDRIALVGAHSQWGDRVQLSALQQPIVQGNRKPRVARKKIRIGFMSSDLRRHPVTYFVEPLLEDYDRSQFELYCYSFFPGQPDTVQQRIAAMVDGFRVITTGTDRDTAQSIADDDLDILFEIGGHTLLSRVTVCAWKPAPIQVSWLGYPHSSGLSNIDYILVDPFNKPVSDDLLIEKPFLMPETWVSLGDLGFYDIPINPELPQDHQGYFTFGTANNPYKYSPQCFAAWAKVLKEVAGSKFLFLRPEGGSQAFRDNVLKFFSGHGIPADSILFEPVRGTHMHYYNRIDIALDTFPHVGGTTTCESIWMGVPVITLTGPAFFERLSTSNLHNAGLGYLCANDVGEYVRIAVNLAGDREHRLFLRYGLRDQIRSNPLGQTERFTRNFEAVVTRTLESH